MSALAGRFATLKFSNPKSAFWERMLRMTRAAFLKCAGVGALGLALLAAFAQIWFAAQSSPATLQTARNLGKAYFEQGKYPDAVEQFQRVVASGKALASDHLNLGMALMEADNLDAALGEMTTARQMDPHLVSAEYNLGILAKRAVRYPDAEAALKQVAAVDPDDPAALFNLGAVYCAERKIDDCLDAYRRVTALGFAQGRNFYVAALYRTFTALARLKRQDEAQQELKRWEAVRNRVPNISLQDRALESGKYGVIEVPLAPPVGAKPQAGNYPPEFREVSQKLGLNIPPSEAASFDPRTPIKTSEYSLEFARKNLLPLFQASIAVGDYDNDGFPDVYVVEPSGGNHLFHNDGVGGFVDVTEKTGMTGPAGSISATFADFDNSGKMSLFVAGLGGVKVYQYDGGEFHDITEKAGIKPQPGEIDTRAVLFDADDDGFLDLVVTAYTNLNAPPQKDQFVFPKDFAGSQTHFYRNNGDGTFSEITASTGLQSARGRIRGAAFADFENHGYNDLFLFRDDGPPLLYENQGEDKFVERPIAALGNTVVLDAQVADFNHDGFFDLAVWSDRGGQTLINQQNGSFAPSAAPRTVADVAGDPTPQLLAADARGAQFFENGPNTSHKVPINLPLAGGMILAALVPNWRKDPGKLYLLETTPLGQMRVFEDQGHPEHWIDVKMTGMKSNTQGIGSEVEVKAGDFYEKVLVTHSPFRVFTGDVVKLDVLRATWPNAVVQNWIDVPTDKLFEVREAERLASSCPFLYAWDGKKFVYVTDVLGMSPLGELAPDGTYTKPYPEEFVRLPGWVQESHGKLVFQLTDEMREADFFDQVRLVAVDHPAGEEVLANEIYSSNPGPASLYAVSNKRFPVSAIDERGHDVLPLILRQDGRFPTGFAHNRILGMADTHSLTLDLGEFPANAPVSLWLNGWVFWTDSNGSRALEHNRELTMISPYLQVRDAAGKWVTAIPDMGLPSGTHRTMRVDLTGKFLTADHHVRIVTNLCAYWDQIFFTTDETPVAARPNSIRPSMVEMLMLGADLHYRGFSTPASDPQHVNPDEFDYEKVMTAAPWNPLRGNYTRYGAVEKLLARPDDELVAMATGDEMTVEFSPDGLPKLKPGWKRNYFLYLRGYAKDGEPNTAFAWTVLPMPFQSMSNYPPGPGDHPPSTASYQQYLREYQMRPGYALIPPLAPAIR